MFNLFNKKPENKSVEVVEPKAVFKGKTTNEVIEEIHETFYTEVDRLLDDALKSNSLDTDKQELIDKCNRLKRLGFTNTHEVKETEKEITRLHNLKRENETKQNLIEAINYFRFKYPTYKFITESSVKKICKKYGLVHGEVSLYTGKVPDKNMAQMEQFKVLDEDECFIEEDFYLSSQTGRRSISKKYKSHKEHKDEQEKASKEYGYGLTKYYHHGLNTVSMVCPLEIAAPVKDCNMEGMEVKDYKISKIEIPDPVVLKPVIFNKTKYYLIVTAWGIEGSDEMVINEINN